MEQANDSSGSRADPAERPDGSSSSGKKESLPDKEGFCNRKRSDEDDKTATAA